MNSVNKNILQKLQRIISLTKDILALDKDRPGCLSSVRKLLDKRGNIVGHLVEAPIDKEQLNEEDQQRFDLFFDQYDKLDQELNGFLKELSLSLRSSLNTISKDRKIKKKYTAKVPTSTFLDTRISQ